MRCLLLLLLPPLIPFLSRSYSLPPSLPFSFSLSLTGTIRRFLEHYGEEIDLVIFVSDTTEVTPYMFAVMCLTPTFISYLLPPSSPPSSPPLLPLPPPSPSLLPTHSSPPCSLCLIRLCRSTFLAMQRKRNMQPKLYQRTLVRGER